MANDHMYRGMVLSRAEEFGERGWEGLRALAQSLGRETVGLPSKRSFIDEITVSIAQRTVNIG